ncbi:MAG: DinB family protein [Bacteroidota bacterium]|jgi:uncharacterized damage-inducible protein DinB|nr:MAG: hypothetical protein DIU61_04975 [Bacteroidota bacterium]
MHLKKACTHILEQLADVCRQIQPEHFAQPVKTLSMATIGQHIRHTLEFFICLERGVGRGVVNYDKRAHDRHIETDKDLAASRIESIKQFVSDLMGDTPLTLEVGYDLSKEQYVTVHTNFSRELVYNIEHAVHHMALIKIGVREIAPYVQLPSDFGIAPSTIRYKEMAGAAH